MTLKLKEAIIRVKQEVLEEVILNREEILVIMRHPAVSRKRRRELLAYLESHPEVVDDEIQRELGQVLHKIFHHRYKLLKRFFHPGNLSTYFSLLVDSRWYALSCNGQNASLFGGG
jgi:hypothetical protein